MRIEVTNIDIISIKANKFINNHFMNSKAYKKDKKSSKSAQKKYNIQKNQINLLLYKNSQGG